MQSKETPCDAVPRYFVFDRDSTFSAQVVGTGLWRATGRRCAALVLTSLALLAAGCRSSRPQKELPRDAAPETCESSEIDSASDAVEVAGDVTTGNGPAEGGLDAPTGPGACPALDELETRYETAVRAAGEAMWTYYTSAGSSVSSDVPAAAVAAFAPIFEAAPAVVAACAPAADDTVLRRRLEMWRRAILGWRLGGGADQQRIALDVDRRIADFRLPEGPGLPDRKELARLAHSTRSRERERALAAWWGGMHSAVIDDVLGLVRRRLAAAAEAGVDDYATTILELRGTPPELIDPLLDALEQGTRASWEGWLFASATAAGIPMVSVKSSAAGGAEERLPAATRLDLGWMQNSSGNECNDRWPFDGVFLATAATLKDLGIDVEAIPVRRAASGGAVPAFALWVSVPDDLRMGTNPVPSLSFWEQVFHETGHIVQGASIRTPWPMLKGYEWIPGTVDVPLAEGSAQFVGGLLDDPGVLARHGPLAADRIPGFFACRRIGRLHGVRNALSEIATERALYEGGADPAVRARELDVRFLRIATPADVPATWAINTLFATYPLYVPSYLLGEMAAAQMQRALRRRFGDSWTTNAQVGPLLVECLWREGETRGWTGRVRCVTGEDLSVDALLESLAGQNVPETARP
jgi:hypothetical protein